MKVAPLLGAALVIYVAIPGSNQGKGKPMYCKGANGNRYKKGESYEDKENCLRYTCTKIQNKLKMEKENIIPCTGDISTIVEISQKRKRTITDTNLNTVINFNVHNGMGSDCYSKYSKIYPYPAAKGKSLSECQTICTNNPECGAILMLKASIESGGSTSCYMVKPNYLFNEGTCTWGSGSYNAYEKKCTVIKFNVHNGMGSDCYSKYSKVYPYPAGQGKSLSECQTMCINNPECGAILMLKASVESEGSTSCYMVKSNNLFNEGTCTWGSGTYNAYEKKITVCTADATNEAACFCKSGTSGAGEVCTPEQKCNGDGTCQDGQTDTIDEPNLAANVIALETTFQALQDSVQSMQGMMATIQSTSNQLGTCMSDLSSSDCPDSAPGKVGVVDGISTNKAGVTSAKADINTNKAFISINKAGVTSAKADINTNKADINTNKASINTNKAGINTNKADINTNKAGIMENKAAIAAHHDTTAISPATTTETSTTINDIDTARASSTVGDSYWGAKFAIDGVIRSQYGQIFHSLTEDYPWLEICLSSPKIISAVTIFNRPDGYEGRFKNAEIRIGMSRVPDGTTGQLLNINTVCGVYEGPGELKIDVHCSSPILSKYLTIQLKDKNAILQVNEVQIKDYGSCQVDMCLSLNGCPLVKNNLMTTLAELKKEFYISFEFIATEYGSDWQSIIHFTVNGDTHGFPGRRVPGVWVWDAGKLGIWFPENGKEHDYRSQDEYPVGQWRHMEFSQTLENNKYMYRVKLNGQILIEIENSQPKEFHNVKVYAADPWWSTLKGSLRNLLINTEGSNKCKGTTTTPTITTTTTTDWTIIQRRGQYGNAEDYFYKDFKDYENGFGSVYGELWIGLKNLAALTKDGEWELQVDLTDWDNTNYHAKYATFSVGPAPTYRLHVGGFKDGESTVGDSMDHSNGFAFSARDKDQDAVGSSCALSYKGAWWYWGCHHANLNGLNFAEQKTDSRGMSWYYGKSRGSSYKTWKASVMKIKRVKV